MNATSIDIDIHGVYGHESLTNEIRPTYIVERETLPFTNQSRLDNNHSLRFSNQGLYLGLRISESVFFRSRPIDH